MKTKEKRKTGKTGRRSSPPKTPTKKRMRTRTLNEDEQRNITNVEVDEDYDREAQDHQSYDREGDVEGDEERSSRRRRVEELNDDEAIY